MSSLPPSAAPLLFPPPIPTAAPPRRPPPRVSVKSEAVAVCRAIKPEPPFWPTGTTSAVSSSLPLLAPSLTPSSNLPGSLSLPLTPPTSSTPYSPIVTLYPSLTSSLSHTPTSFPPTSSTPHLISTPFPRTAASTMPCTSSPNMTNVPIIHDKAYTGITPVSSCVNDMTSSQRLADTTVGMNGKSCASATSIQAPHLPAEKDAARKAARIAAACRDRGAHTPDRFRCQIPGCTKFFLRRYNLKVHARKHTGEKPYGCKEPGCGKRFSWRSSMAHHHKAHRRRAERIACTTGSGGGSGGSVGNKKKGKDGLIGIISMDITVNGDEDCELGNVGFPTSPVSSQPEGSTVGATEFTARQTVQGVQGLHGGTENSAMGTGTGQTEMVGAVYMPMDDLAFAQHHVAGEVILDNFIDDEHDMLAE